MGRFRVAAFGVSVDGFGAGPRQSLENPLGVGGTALFGWFFPTRMFQRTSGHAGAGDGTTGVDNNFAERSFTNVGAWILGRNMFGPVRGPWPDESWKGWWGEEPPYHVPVFVLTHHAREPIEMKGGTTFHFVTQGIQEAARLASAAAKGKDVRVGGGVATIQQFLRAEMIDEMHLAVSPVLLGEGERLFANDIDMVKLGFRCAEHVSTEKTMHVVLSKAQ
jgi:dihydrofolate reductase